MSKIFWASSQIDPETKKPRLDFGSEFNRSRFAQFLRDNVGVRFKIDPYTPESSKQRAWFEGALIPFLTYHQENLDWQDTDDLAKVRHWLKTEFNGTIVTVGDKAIKVPKSSKGELNRGLIERILDWAGEQGYSIELLDIAMYQDWRDRIYGMGGPTTYIEYLESIGKLRRSLSTKRID
jgi:hypothetical protein